MQLDYSTLEQEIIGLLDQSLIMVLATAANDKVTARSMSCINEGLSIFFQTDKNFLKYEQIQANHNVALSVNNIQIEGVATVRGHILEKRNQHILDLYKARHYGSYKAYSHLKDNVLIEVVPTLITLWKYEDDSCFRDFLYTESNQARRDYYITNP